MSYTSEYYNALAKLKKRKEDTDGLDDYTAEYYRALNDIQSRQSSTRLEDVATRDDIAPVSKGGNKDSWFKAGAFDDGYQFGDVMATFGSTVMDAGTSIVKGAGRLVEGISDLGGYANAGVLDFLGFDEAAEKLKKQAQYNIVDGVTKDWSEFWDSSSVLGNKADMVAEGIGQVGTIILTGGAASAGGLSAAATSALTTGLTGLSGMGSGMSEAYELGATDEEAAKYGAVVGSVEAASELIFGGLGKGVKALGLSKGLTSIDDIAAKKISNIAAKYITSEAGQKVVGNTLEWAVKSGAEGLEEVISGFGSAIAKDVYLYNDENEKPFSEILADENLLEQFVVGSITSGIAQSGIVPGMKSGSLREANKTGRDFVTGYTASDQAVIDKVVKNRVAEAEKDGKKLSKKEIGKIEEQVQDALEKGQLDIDTIESVLGGETYTAYKDNLTETAKLKQEYDKLSDIKESDLTRKQKKRLDELEAMNLDDTTKSDGLRQQLDNKLKPLLKNSKLTETYNERARRGQTFEADLTKYKGKQREAVERAINSGVLNNTYRSHELVNVLSKIEADKGVIFDYTNNAKLKESGFAIDGKTVNGFVKDGNVTLNVQSSKAWQSTVGHEITHVLEGTESYSALQSALFKYAESKGEYQSRYDSLAELYNGVKGYETDFEAKVQKELTADLVGDYLFTDQKFIQHLTGDRNLFQKVYDEIKYLCKIATGKELSEIEKVKREFDNAWKQMNVNAKTNVTNEAAVSTEGMTEADINKGGVEYDEASQSYSPTRYSLSTWNESDYVTERQSAAEDMSKALGVTVEKATDYIDSVNSIAKMIADDKVRLDYEASPGRSAFVGNAEYGGSIDFSTICKKRRLFTGTFEAIQNALPNTTITPEEILEIRKMMKDKGYEVSCGLCYVEGSRTKMGQYTEQFIERYKATNPEYVPNMAEMNTATGQEKIRKEHPEVYEAYEYFMNHYGKLAPTDKAIFASQQKPKMYQMATEYKGEVLENFGNNDGSVAEKNKNGGLRLQSFSDFEIIHLIDSMQVIMDMSRVGLAGQAYTKVPDFAWALGDTGLKINLSVIAKGVDENGRLIFDEVEGMKESDAMALRDRYSDNVGTIIVTFTDEQLKAAMADERIDYIIPYHRSQWKADQYEMMGLPENTKDYTMLQSESYIEPVYNKNGKKQRPSNYMPNTYWDFNKSGKENAETYLRMCAENNRKPKFSHLLVDNHDGSYSLQPDGSTDGYWKTLIDFKMYNNDGIGVPQNPVAPNFNMEEAQRMLNEYTGGHAKFPIAQDIVDEFVSKHPDNIAPLTDSDIRFSLSESVEETNDLIAVHNLKANELLKTLELGGLPMPSIAIIKAEQEHEKYGDVSLIFPRQTIDPKASSANKVYGGDAWTPTYPRIEYKARESVSQKIKDKYYELADKIGYDAVRPMYRYVSELDSALNSEGGEANLLNWLYDDTKMMQVYLEDSGKGKVEDVIKETRTEATESEKEMNQWFIDKLGEDVVRSFKAPEGVNPMPHRKEFMAQHGEQVKQAYRDFFAEKWNFDEDTLNNIVDKVKQIDLITFMRKAESYLTNGGITIKTETDYDATDAAIREKAADGYQAWVDDLFKGVEEKTGIRNDKDAFTSRGDRRSWDALHWENTLENVVKAMKAQDQTGADAFSPASAIFAVAHKRYGSVEDIKADSDRLGRVSEEEYKAMEESYASRLAQIAKSIQDPSERNQFIASDEAASQIVDAVRNYKTKSGMLRYMQKWNSRVTESTVDDILSLVSDIANMPTGYFEAKPQRAVGLEEVGVFVIPNNADTKLKQELLNKGYSIAEYDPNVEGDRKRVVNQFEEYKFSLSNEGEEFAPIGNYSTPLSDTALEQDIAPVREGIAENATTTEGNNAPAEEAPQTVDEKISAKLKNLQTELDNNKKLRDESNADFDSEIARLQAEYDAKKDKNTKTANNLLRRIERMQRLKANVNADYESRISTLSERVNKVNTPQYKRGEQRRIKEEQRTNEISKMIGDTSSWQDKKLGISYQTNTLHRNLRDVVRDANGKRDIAKADEIYEYLQGSYNRNEAELKRESQAIKQKYADMKINKYESEYIQMLGEFQYNPETKLTQEVLDDYFDKHGKRIDIDKVKKAIEESRKDYDSLIKRVNAVLREQGMKEIGYKEGYYPHFTDTKQSWLAKLFNWKTIDTEIPTDIAGLTEDFEPVRTYQSFDKQRKSDVTDYNFLKGFDTYVHGALDWIYHIEDIQKRRAFENEIRYSHSEQGVRDRIDEIRKNKELDADEVQALIDNVYKEAKNPLNNFVTDLRNSTNNLAGKKSTADRSMEYATNRKVYSTMTNISNRVSGNMVAGSISSALTNFIPITQSWGQVSPVSSLRAVGDVVRNAFRNDGMIEKSTFMTNRLMGEENLYQTGWDKASKVAGGLMDVIDQFTTQVVWRSKYIENMNSGMSEVEAINNADVFAENVMAGRSRGNMPTIYNSKNPVTKMLTAFQLEVANQYGYMFKDMPQDIGSENIGKLAKGYATMFIGAYVYNALFSKLTGRDAAFDPIGILEDLMKDLGFGSDDEEEEADVLGAVKGLGENILQEVPYVGGLLGGGRVPISSALPYDSVTKMVTGTIDDVANEDWANLTNEWLNPVYYLALPFGGGQIKKTNEGLGMFSDEHPVSGSYTTSGNLRFPVEDTPLNRLQAGLFGQYASENAREYFDNDYAPLKEKQIQEYIDVDIPIKEYWEYREGLTKQNTLEDKFDYISGLDLPIDKKNILINNVTDRKEKVDLTGYEDFSSLEEFDFANKYPDKYALSKSLGGYSFYKTYTKALNDITADKDSSGKSITGSRKEKVLQYINNLDADYETKILLYKSEYPSDDTYNAEIINYLNNRSDLTYDDRVAVLTALGFRVVNGQIYAD